MEPERICVVDCRKEWPECRCRKPLALDPMPRTDVKLPPREPEASQIATLAARLAEVERERDQLAAELRLADGGMTDRAERLATALREIVDSGGSYGSLAYMQRVDGIARAALQQEGGE